MKTSELIEILKPLGPCKEGIAYLRKYNTVAQAYNDLGSENPKGRIYHLGLNFALYLWKCVAAADTDDVFANELIEFGDKINEWGCPYYTMYIEDIDKDRELGYLGISSAGAFSSKSVEKEFLDTFRCPTDKELRQIKKWVKGR